MHNVNGSTDKLNLELFYYCHFSKWENQKEVQIISFEFLMNTEQTGFHKATPSSIIVSYLSCRPVFCFPGFHFVQTFQVLSATHQATHRTAPGNPRYRRHLLVGLQAFFFFRRELIETSQSNWYLRNPLKMSISKNTRSHKLMTKNRFSEMLIRKVEGWRGRGELMVLNDYLC